MADPNTAAKRPAQDDASAPQAKRAREEVEPLLSVAEMWRKLEDDMAIIAKEMLARQRDMMDMSRQREELRNDISRQREELRELARDIH